MNIADPKERASNCVQDIEEEVTAFRTKLRSSEYLPTPNIPVSLDGEHIDPDLRHFCKNAREKRAKYVDCFLAYQVTAGLSKPKPPSCPIFINDFERHKYTSIEGKTISEIKFLVQQGIQSITNELVREALNSTWIEISKSNKPVLLNFFYELEEYMSDTIDNMLADDDGDNDYAE